MAIEMPTGEWQNQTADFHLDPSKTVDVVEQIIERRGSIDDAFDEIAGQLEKDPNNPELRRQANLLINRLEDLASKLRERTSS